MGVRPLRPDELSAVAPLLLGTNSGVFMGELERDLRRSQARWPSLQLVAEVNGEVAGLVAGRIAGDDERLGWSDDLIVLPGHRGRGLGDALITAQLDAFWALGCTRVRGLSPLSLARQVGFFERHGFHIVGEEFAHGLWGVTEGERVFVTEVSLAALDSARSDQRTHA